MEIAMRLAMRMNSFLRRGDTVLTLINSISEIAGITDLELNYPEHLRNVDASDLLRELRDKHLTLSGLTTRFRDDFVHGELGVGNNGDKALSLVRETIETAAKLGASVVTIWLAYDGNDYSFQVDYARSWDRLVHAFREIADCDPNMRISIEFKPYDPRSFSMVPGTGYSLHLIERIGRANVGMTMDFCHALMGSENPAMGLSIALAENRLFGVHLNDGYGRADDGLIFGSVNLIRALELVYYLKRYSYDGLIYFDTFPVREDPYEEAQMNVQIINRLWHMADEIGMNCIDRLVLSNDGIAAQRMVLDHLLKETK
jgi:xylose isomerase